MRTRRGVCTRSIWMSREIDSRPTPTVKTGTPSALSGSSEGATDASVVSAAVGDHDDARKGQPGERVVHLQERLAHARLRAGESQVRRALHPLGRRREAEQPYGEPVRQASA